MAEKKAEATVDLTKGIDASTLADGQMVLGHVGDALKARHDSETRVRRFVADASHELRTPLAAIRGYAELTRRSEEDVSPQIAHAMSRVESEAVLLGLDQAGIAAHSGSACSSEALEPSPVLEAMGVDAQRSLRLSVGWSTTRDDTDAFSGAFAGVVARLRSLAG